MLINLAFSYLCCVCLSIYYLNSAKARVDPTYLQIFMYKRAIVVQVETHVLSKRLDVVLGMWVPNETVELPELPCKVMGGRVVVSGSIVLRIVK